MEHFLAGALAGATATGIAHPIDAMMVLQVRGTPMSEILASPGRLYNGVFMSMFESTSFNGFNFGIYELIKAWVEQSTGQPLSSNAVRNMLVSALSSSICQFISCPQKRVQYRMQAGDGSMGVFGHAAAIYNEGGILAFWEGIQGCLAAVPDLAIQFYLYDWLKLWYSARMQKAVELFSPIESMLLGLVAKALSVSSVFPARYAKITAQTQSKEDAERNGASVLGIWKETLETKGFMGLYDGLWADVSASSTRNAIKFFLKDYFTLAVAAAFAKK